MNESEESQRSCSSVITTRFLKIVESSPSIFKEGAFVASNDPDVIMKTCYFKSFEILCHLSAGGPSRHNNNSFVAL